MNTTPDYSHIADCVSKFYSLSTVPMDERPKKFWAMVRTEYGTFCEQHYDDLLAQRDIAKLEYTDSNGTKHKGAHWTCEQVEEATRGKSFSEGVTKWDKYVAYNVVYSDLCRVLTESQILSVAYTFFFDDEDFEGENKIWTYMSAMD